MSIPILGAKDTGVADLRPEGVREPRTTAEWINHPANKGMKEFVLLFRKSLRQRVDEGEEVVVEDILAGYLAGFLSGMTLIQGVFLGSDAFAMAEEIVLSLPAEDPEDPPKPEGGEDVGGEPEANDELAGVSSGVSDSNS